MQNAKIKMQNDKEKFKKEFIHRLVLLSITAVRFSDKLKLEKISYSILDQFIRSITSIGANVVEAKSSHSTKDYIKFFEIALKSANETKFWLLIMKEITKLNKAEANEILCETIEIANIIAKSIMTMKNKK
jgi:four helix bundle protein